ncbi:MAG: methyltransferase domain-containing protein [Bacteroidia bacterium]
MDKTKLALHVFDSCAKGYQDKFMFQPQYYSSFDFFCNAVKMQQASLLELGCGPGNITRYLIEKRPDFKILGTDLAPNMVDLARVNNPAAEFKLMDCRDLLKLNKKWDAIVCGFCLPYLDKEEAIRLIQDISAALNPGGILYLSTMEDSYSKSGMKSSSDGAYECFIHYHEGIYLQQALEEAGFKILLMERVDYTDHLGVVTKDLLIVASLNVLT